MKKGTFYLITFLLLVTYHSHGQGDAGKENWLELFNHKDLAGWHAKIKGYELKDNYQNTFRVVDGMLVVSYDGYEKFDNRFGHIFYEKPFNYYHIAVEYRFTEPQVPGGPGWAVRNSGIMIHCQPPSTMSRDQDFPISIEVQLLAGTGSGKRPTANVCTPGTHIVMDGKFTEQHCINSKSETYPGEQWVRVEVIVLGDSLITHVVEGDTVLVYSKPQVGGGVVNDFYDWAKKDGELLTGGYISLQSESHPIQFRKVELLELEGCLDPRAENYKSYYIKARNSDCIYK